MVEAELIVQNRAGIHTRPASQIVKCAAKYQCKIFLIKDDMTINAKSIMGIITLGATFRSKVVCRCDGVDENEALSAISTLFQNRFEG